MLRLCTYVYLNQNQSSRFRNANDVDDAAAAVNLLLRRKTFILSYLRCTYTFNILFVYCTFNHNTAPSLTHRQPMFINSQMHY